MKKIFRNFSIFISIIAFSLVLELQPFPALADTEIWTNICSKSEIFYCDDLGKNAFNKTGGPKDIKLGKIIGVTWKEKGSLIGYSPADSDLGTPEEPLLSPRDAFYFIIDNDTGANPFIRQCIEIEAK